MGSCFAELGVKFWKTRNFLSPKKGSTLVMLIKILEITAICWVFTLLQALLHSPHMIFATVGDK